MHVLSYTPENPACTSFGMQSLKERVFQLIPSKQAELKEVNTKFGATSLGPVTVAQVGEFEFPRNQKSLQS